MTLKAWKLKEINCRKSSRLQNH